MKRNRPARAVVIRWRGWPEEQPVERKNMCKHLSVLCPDCDSSCGVELLEDELEEFHMTEGFEVTCSCGCRFRFAVWVDVINKKKLQ